MERFPAPAFLLADSRISGIFLPGCSEQAGRRAGGEPPPQDLRAGDRAGRVLGEERGRKDEARQGVSRLPRPVSPPVRRPAGDLLQEQCDGRVLSPGGYA